MNFSFRQLKPGVSKKSLLFIAATFWTFAGCFLFFRGFHSLLLDRQPLWISLIAGISGGFLFYWLVFLNISNKYIRRIIGLEEKKPCAFSFFSWKSYLIMGSMITLGIIVSRMHLFSQHTIHVLFIMMSTPLILAGLRFYSRGITFASYVQ